MGGHGGRVTEDVSEWCFTEFTEETMMRAGIGIIRIYYSVTRLVTHPFCAHTTHNLALALKTFKLKSRLGFNIIIVYQTQVSNNLLHCCHQTNVKNRERIQLTFTNHEAVVSFQSIEVWTSSQNFIQIRVSGVTEW
jgi:hypothetical protein